MNNKVAFGFAVIPFLIFVIPMHIAFGIYHGFKMALMLTKETNDL
jgi:hypothetical protein